MYYDVNNLYGWAMSTIAIRRISMDQRSVNFDMSAIVPDSSAGYILKVDLEYLQHLSTKVGTDLPFCPTRDKPPASARINF